MKTVSEGVVTAKLSTLPLSAASAIYINFTSPPLCQVGGVDLGDGYAEYYHKYICMAAFLKKPIKRQQ